MKPSWWRGLPALASAIPLCIVSPVLGAGLPEMVHIPGGKFLRFFVPRRGTTETSEEITKRRPISLSSFQIDRLPVTNADFFKFVESNPRWSKTAIAPIFADSSYLKNWSSDMSYGAPEDALRPVTQISWFAAKAYCNWKDKSLPTTDQWEYVAQDRNQNRDGYQKKILEWYGKPNSAALPQVGVTHPNSYGVHDLLGVVWEWTLDFNSALIGAEIRDSGVKDENLFCGAGSLGALDPSDYATFMRFSFRTSLNAAFTTANLGFRCAKEIKK